MSQPLAEVSFATLQEVKVYQKREVIVSASLRTDEPDILISVQVTHKHGKNPAGPQTIESMTVNFEEFLEIVEAVKRLYGKMQKVEEIL